MARIGLPYRAPSRATAAVAVVAFSLPFLGRYQIIGDGDTFLHVAAGRWILEHRQVPLFDPFSGGLPGARWVAHEWLAQVVLAMAHGLGGVHGLVALAAGCFALTLALLHHRLARDLEPAHALLVTAFAGSLYAFHLLARPHIMAIPIGIAFAICLLRAREANRAPAFASLLLMLLWANLHGSYPLGLALAGLMAAEALVAAPPDARWRIGRDWGRFIAAGLVAVLLTPNGVASLAFPFELSSMSTVGDIIEWRSPNFRELPVYQAVILGLIALPFATGVRLPAVRLVLLLGLVHLSLTAVRHIELLVLFGPLFAAPVLGPQIAALRRAAPSSLDAVLGADVRTFGIGCAAALMIAAAATFFWLPMPLRDDANRPVSALDAADAAHLEGTAFNAYGFGSYMVFLGQKPYIDGRMDMYGAGFYGTYRDTLAKPDVLLAPLLDGRGIGWTILIPDTAAARVMDRLSGWRKVYEDKYAVVHARVN